MPLHKYLNSDLETMYFEETKANKYWITNSYLQFPLKKKKKRKLMISVSLNWGDNNLPMLYKRSVRTLFSKLTFPVSF